MCFSAPVSFISSAVLAVTGIALLARVKNKRLWCIAIIPLVFSLQQAAEGLVWLNLPNPSFAQNLYLFFAYVFWPLWIPFSLWIAENILWKKRMMLVCLCIGFAVAIALFPSISGVVAMNYCHSIMYDSHTGVGQWTVVVVDGFYLLSVGVPFLISSIEKFRILGGIAIVSAAIIYGIDQLLFISMWCFFMALVTIGLFFILPKKRV